MRFLIAAFIFFSVNFSIAAAPTEIKGITSTALSSDGKMVAFEWSNDIWLAPSQGGKATQLTDDSARDAYPRFSADDTRLVFSSEMTGSQEIHSLKLDGSDLRQHSDHSGGNILEAISTDGSYAIARGLRDASGYKPFRLVKVDLTQDSRELLLFDATAHSVSISPDGSKYLFNRSGEQPFRGGYHGSRSAQVYLYDEKNSKFQTLINEDWEARFPMWKNDGKGFYYLSNKTGSFNIWSRKFDEDQDKQLTFFDKDSVILPSISTDGKVMVFRVGYKTYRFAPEGTKPPEEIHFFTKKRLPDLLRKEKVKGTSSVAFHEANNQMVFSATGDLWVMNMNDKEVSRLTDSDATDEREFQLSADGKSLFYLSDDGLITDVLKADLGDESITQKRVIASGQHSKRSLRLSPNGEYLSWLEKTGNLVTLKLDGSEARVVMHNWDMPSYDWSPDGKWLVVAAKDIYSNRDLWLVASDGSSEPINLTWHPAFEGSPKWSPDGTQIVFSARREMDELSRLWTIQVGSLLAENPLSEESIKQITNSVKRIETDISETKRVIWTEDSKSLLFQSRADTGNRIYKMDLDGGRVDEFAPFSGIPEASGGDGITYWRCSRVPKVYDGKKLTTYDFTFPVEQDRSVRLKLGFRKVWRTLSERFYDKSMNATNWQSMLEKYESAAADSRDSRQFDRVIGQLLGELNASHLTFQYTPWGLKKNRVSPRQEAAHPGLEFEANWEGALVIKKVIPGTPISDVDAAPVAGETVKEINGHAVNARMSLAGFFNGAAGKSVSLVVENLKGNSRNLKLVPLSYEKVRALDREQKIAEAKAATEARGLVYLPFSKMKSAYLEKLSIDVYRASTHAKGIIIDLRDNAGGRVADELLALFCQPVHTFTIPRDGPQGYPTDRRVSPSWDGPMVVLCNENTFSNAEIFCHAFKQIGRGKLVGMPTNGGVISAVDIGIPEVGDLQIPFRGWFHAQTGKDLELNGAVPDIIVQQFPDDQVAGRDLQLEVAIKALEQEVRDFKPFPNAILKSETGE